MLGKVLRLRARVCGRLQLLCAHALQRQSVHGVLCSPLFVIRRRVLELPRVMRASSSCSVLDKVLRVRARVCACCFERLVERPLWGLIEFWLLACFLRTHTCSRDVTRRFVC